MARPDRVLLTGFEPFWGYSRNVSQMAVLEVAGMGEYPFEVVSRVLPTSFKNAPQVMAQAIAEVQPDVISSFGLMEDMSAFRLERVGLNINHTHRADNDGDKPQHRRIVPKGPLAYEVNLPFAKLYGALEKAGLPVEVSYHAGTFVCNHLIYTTMHLITSKKLPVKFGFMHLPRIAEDVKDMPPGTPCLPFEVVLKGVNIAVSVLER